MTRRVRAEPCTRTTFSLAYVIPRRYGVLPQQGVWMRIQSVALDEDNLVHVTRHGVSADEIVQVFDNSESWHRNKRSGTADFTVVGRTDGGARVRVNFVYDPRTGTARPISAWRLA